MKTNKAGLALIREFEGVRLEAYKCPAGVWTIGYGHTEGVKKGDRISKFEADEMLEMDVQDREPELDRLLGTAKTAPNQYAALMSLMFNIGVTALAGSTALKRHKLGNYVGAANAILMWNKAGGKILAGLVRRREAERKLYLA